MAWIAALVVWLAAGARVGRMVVRPATTVRICMVLAMVCTAAAQTVAIDDVAATLGRDNAAAALAMCWAGGAGASMVIAIRAWPTLLRRWYRTCAVVIAVSTAGAMAGSLLNPVAGWCAVLPAFAAVIAAGVRVIARTPIGRAVALYCLGAVAPLSIAIAVILGAEPNRGVLTVGALIMSIGAVSVLIETWIRARILLYRIKDLHHALLRRFPELRDSDRSRAPTVLQASDHVSDVMDGLYLQVGAGQFDDGVAAPNDPVDRAARIARTVHDPLAHPILGAHWIVPPPDWSPPQWVALIARAHRSTSTAALDDATSPDSATDTTAR